MKNIFNLLLLCISLATNAQPSWFWQASPSGPYIENSNPQYSNWEKQTLQSDDFTGTQLDLSKWAIWNHCSLPLPEDAYAFDPNWPTDQGISIEYDASILSDVLNLGVNPCSVIGGF